MLGLIKANLDSFLLRFSLHPLTQFKMLWRPRLGWSGLLYLEVVSEVMRG